MSITLSKGQKVSLEKVATDAGIAALKKIYAGLGWDTNKYAGGGDFDLDAAVFLIGADGKTKETNFVYFGNKETTGVKHMGDNLTGAGDGDDEQIKIDLSAIPADVDKIAFAVTIYQAEARKQNFGMVSNAFIRLVDESTGTELLRYDLGEDYSVETAVIVAELYRAGEEWKCSAVGAGFAGGLANLCTNYGLDIK